ncbi:MAG: hypothetical protein ACOYMN_23160 [Roseimicrobium sp.]
MNGKGIAALSLSSLAAQLIGPMRLPEGWEAEHPDTLAATLGRDTVPFATGWASPFEIVAEAAVARARILLDAASGLKRRERCQWEADAQAAKAWTKKHIQDADELRQDFDLRAKGGTSLSLMDFLNAALPRVSQENQRRYWRTYLRESVQERQGWPGEPRIPVVFTDEASDEQLRGAKADPPTCAILDGGEARRFDRNEYPHARQALVSFFKRRGDTVRKKWARDSGAKGGKMSVAKQIAEKGEPMLRPSQAAKIDRAARKSRLPHKRP